MEAKHNNPAQPNGPGPYGELLPWFEWLDRVLAGAMTAAQSAYGEAAAADPYRGLYISHRDFENLLARGPAAPAFVLNGKSGAPRAEDTRLGSLARRFGLSTFEAGVVVIALAPEADLRYERLYAYLQDDVTRRHPTIDLVLNLLCGSAEEKFRRRALFSGESALLRYGLVRLTQDAHGEHSSLARAVRLDGTLVRYLLHQDALDLAFERYCRIWEPQRPLEEVGGSEPHRRAIAALADRAKGDDGVLRLYFEGPDSARKRRSAEAIATLLHRRLLTGDLEEVAAASPDADTAFRQIFREARYRNAALLLTGVDAFRQDDRQTQWRSFLRTFSEDGEAPAVVMLSGEGSWNSLPAPEGSPAPEVFLLSFPVPSFGERRAHWSACLARQGVVHDDADIEALAGRFRFSEEQIDRAVEQARRQAFVRAAGGEGATAPTIEELYAVARAQSTHNLGSLARKITPRYSWKDIVLPEDAETQLREICNQAKYRHLIYGEWGFDQKLSLGKGLNVLFSGPPGTGKTMGAEVIGGELQLDIYRIDLSQIVSKYIGETERNLNKVFTEARTSNAILFFDEADALFGKRSEVRDAHDRYANIEISYLLQKMEEYEGISVLATNLRQNLDEAFTRRLSFVVDFPFPAAESRRRIWTSIWPRETPLSKELDLDFIAARFKLSGGSIKNVALAAAFLAADEKSPVKTEHVLRATRREFQKMGKTLAPVEYGNYAELVAPALAAAG
jgi:AAA+ superfamily predicted ATPase